MADQWYSIVTGYTDMMRAVNQDVQNILELNAQCGMLDAAQCGTLTQLCRENDMLTRKMETRAFEVAVVGLENSGKSSVANALIGIPALPSASVRCTYTTTEIRADEQDRAQVDFYTPDEFLQRLRCMLEELGYPGAQTADFSTLSAAHFETVWEDICQRDPMKRRLYDATTAEDVKAILRSSALLQGFLGRPSLSFEGEDALLSSEFQSYITGQTDASDALQRDERPYAVKRVTIWSSHLQAMRNIVLYDVPGFNSPTLLHREQTRRMMDRADAIILVTDMLSNPNIDGTQLTTLREADADHVQLKDKLFVFGNKADLLTDERTYQDNLRTFVSDIVNRHRLTIERRVIVGSARAYFDALHGQPEASDRLAHLGCGTGIDRLRELLTEYYDAERLGVLQARAVSTNRAIIDMLRPIASHFATAELDEIQMREFEQVIQAKDDIVLFRRSARQIVGRMYQDISRRKPFTHMLQERIAQQIHPITTGDSLYQEIIGSLNVQGDSANRHELVNANLRMNMQGYLNTLLERMVWDVARHEEMTLMEELTDALLSALDFDASIAPDAQDIIQRARHLVMRMFDAEDEQGEISGGTPFRARGFIALITRFVPGLTAAIIGYPLGSQGRAEEAVRIAPELTRLYAARGGSEDVDCMVTLAQILTHKDYFSLLRSRNEKALEQLLHQHKRLRAQLEPSELTRLTKRWASLSAQHDIDLSTQLTPFSQLNRSLRQAGRGGEKASAALDTILRDALTSLMKLRAAAPGEELAASLSGTGRELPTRQEIDQSLIASMARKAETARTEEDVLEEINIDIEIYAGLLAELLVPHLNLEKAFYERFINQINAMTGHSSVYDHKADALINAWLKTDVKRIKYRAFAELDALRSAHSSRQRLYDMIASLIAVWQDKYARL